MSLWAVEEKSKPRPSKNGRVGHPEGQRPGKYKIQCLVDDVQQWYYSMVKKYQSKKTTEGCATRPETAGMPITEGVS
jgi:hypothetical protein